MPDRSDPLTTVLDLATSPRRNPDGTDRVLTEVAELARQRREVDRRLRYLVAYARQFVDPRPYKLVDRPTAAGLSISGVRILYGDTEVHTIASALNRANLPAIRADTGNRIMTRPRQEPPP